jgi:hypothetical protein
MTPCAKLLFGLALAGGLASAVSAEAAPRYAHEPGYGYVVAESRYGNGTVTGPVRRTRIGYEVRLPGGTWIPCRRSCTDTLRRETVDFWQNQGRDAPDSGAGYLHWEFPLPW